MSNDEIYEVISKSERTDSIQEKELFYNSIYLQYKLSLKRYDIPEQNQFYDEPADTELNMAIKKALAKVLKPIEIPNESILCNQFWIVKDRLQRLEDSSWAENTELSLWKREKNAFPFLVLCCPMAVADEVISLQRSSFVYHVLTLNSRRLYSAGVPNSLYRECHHQIQTKEHIKIDTSVMK